MAVTIPFEVALMLNFLGVPFAEILAIDEDQVAELAQAVRDFSTRVQATHEDASAEIAGLGSTSSGHSYQALVASWARMSTTNMAELNHASAVVADVLDAAGVTIGVAKAAVVAELAVLATAFAASMAATIATSGLSAALIPALRIAAQRLLTALEQMLLFYIATEVITKAVEPFEAAVNDFVNGWAYDTTADLLGVDTGVDTNTFRMDPDEWERTANALGRHADDMAGHGNDFAKKLADLTFMTPDANLDSSGQIDDRPLGGPPEPSTPPPRGTDDPLGWVGSDHPGLDSDSFVPTGAESGPSTDDWTPSPDSPVTAGSGTDGHAGNGIGDAPVTHRPGVPIVPDTGITDRPEISGQSGTSGRSESASPWTGIEQDSGQPAGQPTAGPQTPWTADGPVAGESITQHPTLVPPSRIDGGPTTHATPPVGRTDQHTPPWSPGKTASRRGAQSARTGKPAEPATSRLAASHPAATPWSKPPQRTTDQPKETARPKVVAPKGTRRPKKTVTSSQASPPRRVEKPPELPESQDKSQDSRTL